METYADNIKPTLIDNIFSDEEYDLIYSYVNAMPEEFKNGIKDTGYVAFYDPTDDDLSETIIKHCEKILGIKLKKNMTHFARYTLDSKSSPQLLPHYDTELNEPCVTLSVILDSNFNWPVVVEGTEVYAVKNQAVLFSGTHQIHWRPDVEFGPDDFYDIMVCQMSEDTTNPVIIDEEHRRNISQRIGNYICDYYIQHPKYPYDDQEWLQEKLDLGWGGKTFCDELGLPIDVILFYVETFGLMEQFQENAHKEEDSNE